MTMHLRKGLNISLLLFFLTLSSCGFFDKVFHKNKEPKPTPEEAELRSLLPIEKPDVFINMSEDNFKATHDTSEFTISNSGKATYYVKEVEKHPLKKTYYMFNNETGLLYEIIYEYYDDVDVAAIMKEKYGEPNHKGQWRINTKSGIVLKVWQYGQKICIGDSALFPFG